MKNKITIILVSTFFTFCFIIFFKGLENSNTYKPSESSNKPVVKFTSKRFFSEELISSEEIFSENKFYILNIWASWCTPCRKEHPLLMQISKNSSVELIGLNYKDNYQNAKEFINELGNPYSIILTDKKGTISIELGAYGVPETFIINKEKKIIKRFIGPLNTNSLEKIKEILK